MTTYLPRYKIFKESGVWYVVHRTFGFSPHVTVTSHRTMKEAHAHTRPVAGYGADTVRTSTPGYRSWSYLRSNNYPMRIQ